MDKFKKKKVSPIADCVAKQWGLPSIPLIF